MSKIHDIRHAVSCPGWASQSVYMEQVVSPARVTLPAEMRQLAYPRCLAPRENSERII